MVIGIFCTFIYLKRQGTLKCKYTNTIYIIFKVFEFTNVKKKLYTFSVKSRLS